jgi:hypothetical protein
LCCRLSLLFCGGSWRGTSPRAPRNVSGSNVSTSVDRSRVDLETVTETGTAATKSECLRRSSSSSTIARNTDYFLSADAGVQAAGGASKARPGSPGKVKGREPIIDAPIRLGERLKRSLEKLLDRCRGPACCSSRSLRGLLTASSLLPSVLHLPKQLRRVVRPPEHITSLRLPRRNRFSFV